MSYELGIDVGTATTTVAIRRLDGHRPGESEIVPVGGRGAAVPSVLHIARDGGVTVGEGAQRLAGIDAARVVRAPMRLLDDPAPLLVGGEPWAAEDLAASLVRRVVDRVAEQEGGPAARVALAYPAAWAAPALERLAAALARRELDVTFVAEARAAAVALAATQHTGPGDAIGVYDLGAGTFDAAVLRRVDTGPGGVGFDLLGSPERLEQLGGIAFDDLVWEHVRAGLPEGVTPDARIRRECTRAREALSTASEVVVRVRRGELRAAVPLDRATFERLVAPQVEQTVAALRRTLVSAGLEPGQLSALLMVGGTSRMPLVVRTVSEQVGRPVAAHADAEGLVARGAVLALFEVEPVRLPGPATSVEAVPGPQRPDPLTAARAVATTASLTSLTAAAPPADVPPTVPFRAVPFPAAGPVDVPSPAVRSAAGVPAAGMAAAGVPAAEVPAVAPRPAAASRPAATSRRARPPAVLDPEARTAGRPRSLGRLLVGAGAVIVAALVLVALLRPDGPLDPPLDPVAGFGAPRATGAPLPAGRPAPSDPVTDPSLTGAEDILIEEAGSGASPRILNDGPTRALTPADEVESADDPVDLRRVVDTTPPAAPRGRSSAETTTRSGNDAARAQPAPTAEPRVPPTPAAPVL